MSKSSIEFKLESISNIIIPNVTKIQLLMLVSDGFFFNKIKNKQIVRTKINRILYNKENIVER
jgi:hypothetical protein